MKSRCKTGWIFGLVAVLAVCACDRVPGYVIQPDKMAELMADVRTADAVVAAHRSDYMSEPKKLALKKAVLERHGVTPEQFDTSLMWYGQNIGKYQEITRKSIEILEKKLKETNAMVADEAAMTVSGDSVDVWDGSRFFIINHRSPSQFITFEYDSDPNWEKGDIYTLRTRLVTQPMTGNWNLTAYYDDGAIETITSNLAMDNPSRQELTLITDSTRTATHISGWINLEPQNGRPVIVDSLGLMRRRTSPTLAKSRRYIQKLIIPLAEELPKDSIEANDSIIKNDSITVTEIDSHAELSEKKPRPAPNPSTLSEPIRKVERN